MVVGHLSGVQRGRSAVGGSGSRVSSDNRVLAVLLRRAQWLLGDLAFQVGRSGIDGVETEDVAAVLDEISSLLREKRSLAHAAEDRR
ncbi:hypothetical protein GCM10025787_08610 [Saccharopolyspora rosea]